MCVQQPRGLCCVLCDLWKPHSFPRSLSKPPAIRKFPGCHDGHVTPRHATKHHTTPHHTTPHDGHRSPPTPPPWHPLGTLLAPFRPPLFVPLSWLSYLSVLAVLAVCLACLACPTCPGFPALALLALYTRRAGPDCADYRYR